MVLTDIKKESLIKKTNLGWKYFLNMSWSIVVYALILALTIVLNIVYNDSLKTNSGALYYVWIVVESFALIVFLAFIVVGLNTINYSWYEWKEKLIYAFISLNLIRIIYVINFAVKKDYWTFKIEKWTTMDYTLIAMSYAIYMILTFICKQLIPTIPILFVSLSFEYIALFFIAFITGSFLKTFVTGMLCGLSLLFFPSTYFINFPQFLLDYLIPNLCVSLACLVNFTNDKQKKISKMFTFMTIPYLGIYLSRVLAGVVFYITMAYPGFPVLLYSAIINGINSMFDYLTLSLITPIILWRLFSLQKRYKNKIRTIK
ncbi:energy-coupled thiamine transporter ThiT [Mesoplasma lactucae]|uniref:Uncharacterized protein n=1 Tax=Mesoplasma lactucae ATCC 49193 TaxID=81460 RepID=A0A291IRF1_9MOLU|nr:energy-coupled thiamine transporter ThiT [Mesoplasma lactucae]ATG97267.1 hypothetical protein CP520_00640 [Mesoplasma lactucae ATCC 49193]ATZ20284.1 hypothetical protein MLACT_v1c04630 [Mesoplasma lactucae ATCC 49193]MCL8216455.1 hypothetical protein [Mesoplasma lactucae ATCC 49193]